MPIFVLICYHSASQQKNPPFQVDFFVGWKIDEETEQKSAQLYCVLVNHRSEILEMKEQVQLIRSLLAA